MNKASLTVVPNQRTAALFLNSTFIEMLEVRLERTQDEQDIRAVLDSAFESTGESRVVDLLRQSGHATISLVAVEDGRIAGHILFSPVVIHPSDPDLRILGLAPVAVHPDFQGRGIGTQLIQYGLSLCREKGYAAVVVLGHPGYTLVLASDQPVNLVLEMNTTWTRLSWS